MKIKNTIPLDGINLIDYFGDDYTLQLISLSSFTEIVSLDFENLAIMNRFSIETEVHNFYSPCIDDSCIYIPTKLGQILGVDKFSGQILTTINLRMPIMSDILQDDDYLYCICGVPLARKRSIDFANFCVCICDKVTGAKKFQTNYLKGNPLMNIGKGIWIIDGQALLLYSCQGELQQQVGLKMSADYPPILDDDSVICVSKEGVVQVFERDGLSARGFLRASSPVSRPTVIDHILVWPTRHGICYVNYKEEVSRNIRTNIVMASETTLSSETLFGCGKNGILVSYDLNNHKTESVKLSNDILRKPIIIEDYLFVASKKELHQLEVN